MFRNNFNEASTSNNPDVDQLREDATQTARDIITGVEENFISKNDFAKFSQEISQRFNEVLETNDQVMNAINTINDKLNIEDRPFERFETPKPTPENDDDSSVAASTHYDLDNDVIMRSRFTYTVNQVPEPGFFTGKSNETDLFCQLCEDTFKTYPSRHWPEDAKVNFVKSRLRDAARNWYLTKYKDNTSPATLQELVDGLKEAFTNVASKKLAKINLINLKQSYGKINDYIEEFRSYSREFNWSEEALTLIFYGGLHPRYQEEINKSEEFPVKLETIITKTILFENSLNTKNKIKQVNQNKSSKKKNSSNLNYDHNSKNKNSNNQYRYNNNNYYNNHNYNNTNKNNNTVSKVQKINSKN